MSHHRSVGRSSYTHDTSASNVSHSTSTSDRENHLPVSGEIPSDLRYWRVKQQIREEYMKQFERSSEEHAHGRSHAAPSLSTLIGSNSTTGATASTTLKNLVQSGWSSTNTMDTASTGHNAPIIQSKPDTLDYIWNARTEWEKRLRFEMRAVARKQNRALIQLRETAEKLAAGSITTSGALNIPPPSTYFQVRFVYTAEDLLEVIANIRNPNQNFLGSGTANGSNKDASSPAGTHHWGLISLDLPVLSLSQLSLKYSSLHPSNRQIGVDDTVLGLEWFGLERMKQGEELLKDHATSISALRQFARTGLHPSLRPQFWARMCGISLPLSDLRKDEYSTLLDRVSTWSLLSDDLIQFDVSDGPGNDEAFFVFHEPLEEILLAFSRDEKVREKSSILLQSAPLLAKPSQALKTQLDRLSLAAAAEKRPDPARKLLSSIPPNRLVPYHRLSYLATPCCFLYSNTAEAYHVFRELYCRYFCRLSIVSSAPSGILSLARSFELLLATKSPHLVYQCLRLGVEPLHCAFGWIFTGFSGCLEVDQLFLLWDRLIAFDSLELLPVLAASIFVWREKSILRAQTKAEIQDCMRELINIKVIPLLQHFLFA